MTPEPNKQLLPELFSEGTYDEGLHADILIDQPSQQPTEQKPVTPPQPPLPH